MPAEMTAQPWPPNGGRPLHHLDPPPSITCRRIGPRDGGGHDLHNDVSEAKPCVRSKSCPAAATKSRHRAKPPSRWCWGMHVPKHCWWALMLVTLLCLKLGLCAGFAARESVPFPAARESRPSPASFLSKQQQQQQGEEEEEGDPLARRSKVFGIKRIPGKVFHRTPPQYMTELYREVADTGGLTRAAGPYNANTIRSFPDRDTVHQQHYIYNVSRLEPQESSGEEEERMLEAEFHIFKMKPRPTRSAEGPPPHHLQLKVYQVLDKAKMDRPEGRRLLDAQRVSTHRHGWLTFKVAKAVDSWRVRPQDNQGLLVVAQAPKGQSYGGSYLRFAQRNQHHDSKQPILVVFSDDASSSRKPTLVSPEDQDYKQILKDMTERRTQQPAPAPAPAPAENKRKLPQDSPKRTPGSEPGSLRPPVPVFDRNMDFQQAVFMLNERARERPPSLQPSVPSPLEGRGRRERRQASGNNKRKRQNRRRKRTYNMGGYRYRRSCAKHKMYVDFDEIGWSGWIISPKGYDAYHCSGECPFPLGQSQKPTNHATVQSIVHALRVGTKNLGTPCCVPNKLFSISLLYFDDDENVILKQYDDMVAASCGCH